jgi:vacuolar-type H+-ATPase subunit I/STV1
MFDKNFDPLEMLQELQRQTYLLTQKTDSQDKLLQQLVQVINNQSALLNQHTAFQQDINTRLNSLERFDKITEVKLPHEYIPK